MKREYVDNRYNVSTFYNFFTWNKCEYCNLEFRREKGYQWYVSRGMNYACSTCISSITECNEMIDLAILKRTNNRPHPPASPPEIRKIR